MTDERMTTPEQRARERAEAYTALMWHIGSFVVLNGFFWILDAVTGPAGFQWAYWITIFWGFGLAFHFVAYAVGESGLEDRKYEKALESEHRRASERPEHAER
jgi:apolipoprotein N-acyltransferase